MRIRTVCSGVGRGGEGVGDNGERGQRAAGVGLGSEVSSHVYEE